MRIRVLLADDSPFVRDTLTEVLSGAEDVQVVGAAADGRALLVMVNAFAPDVVVTDVRMPPTGSDEGIRAAEELAARHPGLGVVVVAQEDDPRHMARLFAAGRAGRAWVRKERAHRDGQLLAAVRAVHAGGTWLDPAVNGG